MASQSDQDLMRIPNTQSEQAESGEHHLLPLSTATSWVTFEMSKPLPHVSYLSAAFLVNNPMLVGITLSKQRKTQTQVEKRLGSAY
jgi:hypothetical protein